MYQAWPFFAAALDNAALALAKTDLGIAQHYAAMVEDMDLRKAIWGQIEREWRCSIASLLRVTGRARLLSNIDWLERSIELRSPLVDVLNLLQIDIFRRLRTRSADLDARAEEALRHQLRLTIQGVAAGMRTTG